MNFSGISRAGILGRLLRLPLGLIPGGMVVRILQRKLRGYRWIATASTHGCWIGSYEMAKQTQFVAALKNGSVVYDVGANVGFYSLLASACVGPAGRVFAFEPLTANASLLERHAQINHLTNITIHPFAVSDHSGKMRFKRRGKLRNRETVSRWRNRSRCRIPGRLRLRPAKSSAKYAQD